MTYSIVANDGTTPVNTGMTVAAKTGFARTYTISVTPPTDDDGWNTLPPTYKIKAVLTNYNTITALSSVLLVVNKATCSCDGLVWEAPSTVDRTVLVGDDDTIINLNPLTM